MKKMMIVAIILIAIGLIGLFYYFYKKGFNVLEIKMINVKSVFENEERIPEKYTCDGLNINPPLEISNIPEGTKTLALIVEDIDVPEGTFVHWIMWNIPPETTKIEENYSPSEAIQGTNDFGERNYMGPCPPSSRTHKYQFKVYALDTSLDVPIDIKKESFKKTIKEHVLSQAVLTGLYSRKQ